MGAIGKTRWAIAQGYLPGAVDEVARQPRATRSHETACLLNAGDEEAEIRVTVFFHDRDPLGPFYVRVAPRRTYHLRFDEIDGLPRETDFARVIVSTVPIVVQHTRLDHREGVAGLLSTVAFAEA